MTSRRLRRLAAWLCLCFGLSMGAPPVDVAIADPATVGFEQSELSIDTAAGTLQFKVELAVTPAQRQRGLMFRQELAADAGMLFDFGRPSPVSMWMRNTYIPLDMLFIAEDGRIVKIVERTIPLSLTTISSDRPVRAVLELKGGTVSRLGISTGDRARYEVFDPDS